MIGNTMSYKNYKKSVGDLLVETANGKINVNPIGQRARYQGWGDSIEIIKSLLEGYSIGVITLRDIRNDDENQKVYPNTDFLVIDGGKRLRAIRDFNLNKFSVYGDRYSDLPDDVQKSFLEIDGNVTTYVVDNKQATLLYRNLNISTDVNSIQMIMSNDTSQYTKEIRQRVNKIHEYKNTPDKLFDVMEGGGRNPKPANFNTDTNPRRKWDEYVAVALLKVIGGGNVNASVEDIEEFANKNDVLVDDDLQSVDKFLDDAYVVRTLMDNKFSINTFAAFQAVWFGLFEQGKSITEPEKFTKEFVKAFAVNGEIRYFTQGSKNFAHGEIQREVADRYLGMMNL